MKKIRDIIFIEDLWMQKTMSQNFIKSENAKLTEILKLDSSIRFVGKIKNRKLHSFVRHENKTPLLDEELDNMAHYQASVKASMENMFDSKLGKTNWIITSKEKVTLITLFLDDGLLILSTESSANHDEIIKKIQRLNMKL